ncbi:hypothetical protein V2J09_016074 [Rumex salicifolius]
MKEFDVILGIDWLSKYSARIDCRDQKVTTLAVHRHHHLELSLVVHRHRYLPDPRRSPPPIAPRPSPFTATASSHLVACRQPSIIPASSLPPATSRRRSATYRASHATALSHTAIARSYAPTGELPP